MTKTSENKVFQIEKSKISSTFDQKCAHTQNQGNLYKIDRIDADPFESNPSPRSIFEKLQIENKCLKSMFQIAKNA